MKINWLLRLKNKTWLAALLAAVASFVFDLLNLFDIAPAITEDTLLTALSTLLTLLAALGVIIDPTTPGMRDSKDVMAR